MVTLITQGRGRRGTSTWGGRRGEGGGGREEGGGRRGEARSQLGVGSEGGEGGRIALGGDNAPINLDGEGRHTCSTCQARLCEFVDAHWAPLNLSFV